MWRFSSDIKRGQAIWKRLRDEVKPTDDSGTMRRGMIVGWVDMEVSGVGQNGRALSWYLVYLLLCVRVVSTHMPFSELL